MNPYDEDGIMLKRTLRMPTVSLGRIAWFRVLLWWGVQSALEILRIRKPEAQIVRVSKTDLRFPVVSWFRADEKTYCIASLDGKKHVTIHAFSSGGGN